MTRTAPPCAAWAFGFPSNQFKPSLVSSHFPVLTLSLLVSAWLRRRTGDPAATGSMLDPVWLWETEPYELGYPGSRESLWGAVTAPKLARCSPEGGTNTVSENYLEADWILPEEDPAMVRSAQQRNGLPCPWPGGLSCRDAVKERPLL